MSILTDVNTLLPHLYPMQWLPSIHNFLSHINASVILEDDHIIPLQGEHDSYIIDIALQYTTNTQILKFLNACRLYLKIQFLIDIVDAKSYRI